MHPRLTKEQAAVMAQQCMHDQQQQQQQQMLWMQQMEQSQNLEQLQPPLVVSDDVAAVCDAYTGIQHVNDLMQTHCNVFMQLKCNDPSDCNESFEAMYNDSVCISDALSASWEMAHAKLRDLVVLDKENHSVTNGPPRKKHKPKYQASRLSICQNQDK